MRRVSLLCVSVLTAVAGACGAAADGERIETYRPSAAVDRLEHAVLAGDDVGLIGDFDMAGASLFLLDRTGRVSIVERRGDRLRLAAHFGRRGAGPGEFLQPTGIAVAGSNIAVIDGTRLQFFSKSGSLLKTVPVTLPCPMMLPGVSASRTGIFISGGCMRGGYASDTMKAVLAWSADTSTWHVIADAPRYTRDGTFGSIFGARSLLTTGNAGVHMFGGGELNCIWSVADTIAPPAAAPHCPVVTALYSAKPPPALRARLRAARIPGVSIRWPESLPAYLDRFVTASGVVLLRPYSTDSLVLQLAGSAPLDLAVAPADGLLGCRAEACVWLRADDGSPAMIVLDRADIERRVAAARSRE